MTRGQYTPLAPNYTLEHNARHTLRFVVSAVAQNEFPGRTLIGGQTVGTTLGKACYRFSFEDGAEPTAEEATKLEAGIQKMIASDLAIDKADMPYAEAVSYFTSKNLNLTLKLLQTRVQDPVKVVKCATCTRLSLAPLFERTSRLADAAPRVVTKAGENLGVGWQADGGFIVIACTMDTEAVQSPSKKAKKSKNTEAVDEVDPSVYSSTLVKSSDLHVHWGKSVGVRCLGDLNGLLGTGRSLHDFILHAEFRQEAIIAALARAVAARQADEATRVGVICIAGPTSSGKTTFATKLDMYMRNNGITCKPLTVDHYYLPLDRQPKYQARKQRSDVDYDAIESMDADLVNEHINALLEGKEVMAPVYNMKTGYRDGDGIPFKLPSPHERSVLIIEGIHALNPDFLKSVPKNRVYKVYISPISALQIDEGNTLKTTDNRLIRRMSRDYLFRGHSASRTLSMWPKVRAGEFKYIFPHQNDVDFVANSSHEYEMMVLKPLVEPLLTAVAPDDAHYAKAQQLLSLLSLFNPVSTKYVPTTSLLREFIGDGAFDCH